MALKSNDILALFSPPLAVLGWQTIRNRKQIACRILKNRSLCQRWTYARPKNILQLQEFYHLRYTPRNCVSEESTDSSAESVGPCRVTHSTQPVHHIKAVQPPPQGSIHTLSRLKHLLGKQAEDKKDNEDKKKVVKISGQLQGAKILGGTKRPKLWVFGQSKEAEILPRADHKEELLDQIGRLDWSV